jgi:hypothetical protein
MSVEKQTTAAKKSFAMTPYKGAIRGNQLVKEGPTSSCGCPCMRWHVHSRRKGRLKKNRSLFAWILFAPCFLFISFF